MSIAPTPALRRARLHPRAPRPAPGHDPHGAWRLLLAAALLAACGPPRREGALRTADGAALAYTVLGDGPDTVLAVHAGPALHARYLEAPLARLAAGRTLVLYDQRGRGRSTLGADGAPPSLARDVADLEAVRAALGGARPAVVAHGYGAAVAVHWAAARPTRAARLLLVSPAAPQARWAWAWAVRGLPPDYTAALESARRAGLDARDPRAFCRRFWGVYLSPATVADRAVVDAAAPAICDAPPATLREAEGTARTVLAPLGTWDWRPVAARVRAPVLVLASARDTLERQVADAWGAAVPGARVVALDGAAHFPWVDAGDDWPRVADAFLAGEWPRSAHRVSPAPGQVARGAR